VLKTRRFGYDGKGQRVFQNSKCDDPEGVISEMGGGPFVLEKLIGFKSEFSIIAARNIAGEIIAFDPATNIHENGILRQSTVPASLDQDTASRAKQVAKTVLEALDYVGVIGIEFFETDDGLLVNEFAPRVHNSGHWTEETCAISQFEQHIRAITGLPLGSVERHHDCKMGNLLGDEAENISQLLQNPNTSVTLYGKLQSREGRKMGHFTELFDLSK
jgi:5-(carboxyamino)imidazole ribonucleotide synthase